MFALLIGNAHLPQRDQFPALRHRLSAGSVCGKIWPLDRDFITEGNLQRADFKQSLEQIVSVPCIRDAQRLFLIAELLEPVVRPRLWCGVKEAPIPGDVDQPFEAFPKKFDLLRAKLLICSANEISVSEPLTV